MEQAYHPTKSRTGFNYSYIITLLVNVIDLLLHLDAIPRCHPNQARSLLSLFLQEFWFVLNVSRQYYESRFQV